MVGDPSVITGEMLERCRVDTLDQLHEIGIFINDYSLSDCNKDMILASIQQTDNLKDLLKKVS